MTRRRSSPRPRTQLPAVDYSPTIPTCNVAGKAINAGARAKCFASYMRIHTFEATGGKTYSQMGRFLTKGGKDTNDAAAAVKDPKTGQPVENGARNIWVTATALTNALNTSFFAEQVALFGIVVGIALLLVGIGSAILALHGLPVVPGASGRRAQSRQGVDRGHAEGDIDAPARIRRRGAGRSSPARSMREQGSGVIKPTCP